MMRCICISRALLEYYCLPVFGCLTIILCSGFLLNFQENGEYSLGTRIGTREADQSSLTSIGVPLVANPEPQVP